jgi:transcriptional regulator with XRE-family HTH domain
MLSPSQQVAAGESMDRLKIKHLLLDQGVTLVRLAARAGIPYDRAVKVVNGYRPPTPAELAAMANALGVPVAAICPDADGQGGSEPT